MALNVALIVSAYQVCFFSISTLIVIVVIPSKKK
ncbi:MAG: hypothetical protein QOD59_1491 [Mycobacterium sp.]|jgi:hypothetical protein|nr:hypothetical protein [Mycobacterium sp.]